MSIEGDGNLPPQVIEENGHEWKRTKFDEDSYQWVRRMSNDEYQWDIENVSLVGTDVPIRVVSLQYLNGQWDIEAAETVGPDHHRPGFTELISSELSHSTDDIIEASELVHRLISKMS